MGLIREGINEVIITTGKNAAPMGIISRNGKERMVLFRGSHTADLVETRGWAVANITYDPVMYVLTAFDDLPFEAFTDEIAEDITVSRLIECEAWAAFRTRVEKRTRDSLLVSLVLLREEQRNPVIHTINRGFNSIIEATVHGTRFKDSRDPHLLSLIEHHAGIVKKCGGPREAEALDLLFDYIRYP